MRPLFAAAAVLALAACNQTNVDGTVTSGRTTVATAGPASAPPAVAASQAAAAPAAAAAGGLPASIQPGAEMRNVACYVFIATQANDASPADMQRLQPAMDAWRADVMRQHPGAEGEQLIGSSVNMIQRENSPEQVRAASDYCVGQAPASPSP